jgi:hypothetical protein
MTNRCSCGLINEEAKCEGFSSRRQSGMYSVNVQRIVRKQLVGVTSELE